MHSSHRNRVRLVGLNQSKIPMLRFANNLSTADLCRYDRTTIQNPAHKRWLICKASNQAKLESTTDVIAKWFGAAAVGWLASGNLARAGQVRKSVGRKIGPTAA